MPKKFLMSEKLEQLPISNGSIKFSYQCMAIVQQQLQEEAS
jgi:hypothetical protein